MDIENTGDQQSTRELADSAVNSAELVATALEAFLKQLIEMGLEKERDITIMVGASKVYSGPLTGEGNPKVLTEAQAKTLNEAFSLQEKSGSVRILDQDKNILFQSKKGQILINDLPQLKQEESTQEIQTESKAEPMPLADKQELQEPESPVPSFEQSAEIPSLDDPPSEEFAPEPLVDTSTVNLSESEVEVLEVASSELSEVLETEKLAPKTQVVFKPGDPLEELGQIAMSQALQISELQAQLSEVNGKLDQLKEWKEQVTPVELANERVGNWFNQQRDKVATKIHDFANRIAASATQKFEEVQGQVQEKVDQGLERQSQAVDAIKTKVTEKIDEARESVDSKLSQAQAAMNQKLGKAGRKAANSFMTRFVDPATKMLVHQMDKIGEVTTQIDGTKTFQTDKIDWHVRPDGSTMLTRKATGERLKPNNVTVGEMDIINTAVQTINQNYGLSQTQAPIQKASSQPPVQKV